MNRSPKVQAVSQAAGMRRGWGNKGRLNNGRLDKVEAVFRQGCE